MAIAQSSHLEEHHYDPNTQTLTIQFQNGAIYQYAGVPKTVYDTLQQNGGAGTFFWAKIRGRYATTKIFDPKDSKR